MQMGYNSDVRHKGVIVHIQTEDRGINAAKIETQVFFSGTILDSRVLSYSELVESSESEEQLENEIQRRMKALHKYFHNQIHRGTYDHRLPIADEERDPAANPAPPVSAQTAAPAGTKTAAQVAAKPAPPLQKAPPTAQPISATPSSPTAPSAIVGERASAFLGVANPNNTSLADALLVALA